MTTVPDAPWIREAERDGLPYIPPVICPICGGECEEIYEDLHSGVAGCNRCIRCRDADEWFADQDHGGESA